MSVLDEYGEGVNEQLDAIEFDDSRRPLWEAIVDAINEILDHPESARSKEHLIITSTGGLVWRVPLRVPSERNDHSVLWGYSKEGLPVIAYVGPWPPLS
jgi:hypothetical protein